MPSDISLSADGSVILVHRGGGNPKTDWLIRLDAAGGQPLGEPREFNGLSRLTPGGNTAAIIRNENGDEQVTLQELSTSREILSWHAAVADNTAVRNMWQSRFSPDGTAFYNSFHGAGSFYRDASERARIWDTSRGAPLSPIMEGTSYSTYAPASDRLLTLTNNLWLLRRAPDGQPRGAGFSSGDGHSGETHPDGLTVVNFAPDMTLRLWQISPEAEAVVRRQQTDQPAATETTPNGPRAAPSLLSNGYLTDGRLAITNTRIASGHDQVWVTDLATGLPLGRPARHQTNWAVRGLALSPDGRIFATGSSPDGRTAGEVRVWDVSTGQLRFPPRLHTNYVLALAFHPSGKILAAGDYNGLVRFWDTSSGEEIGRPLPQGEIVLSLGYSPDGKQLAVGLSSDHTGKPGIRLWNIETGKQIGELMASKEAVKQIEFTPDRRVLLVTHPQSAQLFDATSGRAIGEPMLDETPRDLRPDGRAFLTTGRDGTVKLRDGNTGTVLARLISTSSPATCATFRKDGQLVAVGFQDGSVRLCDSTTAQAIGPPRFLEHPVDKVAFTPDGTSVAGIDALGNSRIWPIPRPLPDDSLDDLRLRIEARTGLHMEDDRSIGRLPTADWRERLERISRLDPSALKFDVDPAWHEPMIREAFQNDHPSAAIWHLDRLLAVRPNDWSLYARRASAWALSQAYDQAHADYAEAERLSSREQVLNFQSHCVLECINAGRWAEALWYLDRQIAARPGDASLHQDRAAVYGKLGRKDDEVAEMARVYELGADEALVVLRAEQLARAGHWSEAAAVLARFGRKNPLSSELAQAWGVACLNAGDRAGYREACMADLAFQGSEPKVIWSALAAAGLFTLSANGLDDYRVPIHWLENRLSTLPADRPELKHIFSNVLGGLLFRAGRIDEAIVRLSDGLAAELNVDYPTDWAFLAMAHARKANSPEARKWLNRLLSIDPRSQPRFWDSHELRILQSEAQSLLLDAALPSDPFQRPRSN
jgi:WD40 repeat protein/Flp pilus assembly protein TadD